MENTNVQEPAVQTTAAQPNPFDDDSWKNDVAEPPATQPEPVATPAAQTPPATTEPEEQVLDADAYLKEQLGFENWGGGQNKTGRAS